jgi:hypothetical protein
MGETPPPEVWAVVNWCQGTLLVGGPMEEAPIEKVWGEARETVRAAAVDLAEVADKLPVQPEEMEAKARILDRLSQEITEAAGMLRRSASGRWPV